MFGIIFEDMRAEYAESVFDIERDSIAEYWTKDQIADLVDDKRALARVGLIDGKIVCYCSMYRVIDEGFVNNLAVKREFRGRGIGCALMMDMIQSARRNDISALTLEVNEHNTAAIKLYEKFGFAVEGRRDKFYGGKDAALIMWKRDLND